LNEPGNLSLLHEPVADRGNGSEHDCASDGTHDNFQEDMTEQVPLRLMAPRSWAEGMTELFEQPQEDAEQRPVEREVSRMPAFS
jgi:hypothetical protein